ncbi:hypothetical protein GCM10010172_57240 [Paractinoplanes ferrugineus]|uniref:Secreted protein n=1 Tax=Paractinoplanes ferrugineus TaxID=113564 RepID=A0A919J571_9ACTN|nr:hypothetical protein [Actinoplanes ferrugineus]GIE10806.1 hypothetical protein Afe05nite_26460 [Actinoplanes ferrugineus]
MRFRRSALSGGTALLLLAGCAQPGTTPESEPTERRVVVTTPPGKDTLPCATTKATPRRSATAAATAGPPDESPLPSPSNEYLDEQYRGEMLQRQMRANRAFLDRHELPPAAVSGAVKCALAAEDALMPLIKKRKFDRAAVQKALAEHGLPDSTVRRPTAHDIGFGDGWTIAAWTGQACVLGWLSEANGYHVEYASRTADGGCLPAAD